MVPRGIRALPSDDSKAARPESGSIINVRKENLARLAGFLMPLRENLIELKDKKLIACRQCRTVADVSMNNSLVKLVCPKCRAILGSWPTASEAAADMSAFVASTEQQH